MITVFLIILCALIVVGGVLKILDRKAPDTIKPPAPPQDECCGQHQVCERESLLAAVSERIEYFDDEELDRFRGRPAEEYSPAEVDEFRQIMLSTRQDEVAAWTRSLQLRGIELPLPLRDELFLLISELRTSM